MGFINGVKTVFSDLKQYINQIDCPAMAKEAQEKQQPVVEKDGEER